jgi:putative Holliday junction resolvase
MPDTPETVLAFDFGLRRIGVAVGQQVTRSASPLGVLHSGDRGPDWSLIEALVREWQPARLIVGMPARADGTPSDIDDVIRSFIRDLGRFELPVEEIDERYTSVEAKARLKERRAAGLRRGKIRKEMIDAGAATLIAERWLNNAHQSA